MSETRVVRVTDRIEGAVYVGRSMGGFIDMRGSVLGNPFRVQDMGREMALYQYIGWLNKKLVDEGDRAVIEALIACRGKPLACWCRSDGEERDETNGCHADTIVAVLRRFTDDELRGMIRG